MNLKNIEAGSKKMKKSVLFKEGRKKNIINIVVNDINNVHNNISLLFYKDFISQFN